MKMPSTIRTANIIVFLIYVSKLSSLKKHWRAKFKGWSIHSQVSSKKEGKGVDGETIWNNRFPNNTIWEELNSYAVDLGTKMRVQDRGVEGWVASSSTILWRNSSKSVVFFHQFHFFAFATCFLKTSNVEELFSEREKNSQPSPGSAPLPLNASHFG